MNFIELTKADYKHMRLKTLVLSPIKQLWGPFGEGVLILFVGAMSVGTIWFIEDSFVETFTIASYIINFSCGNVCNSADSCDNNNPHNDVPTIYFTQIPRAS